MPDRRPTCLTLLTLLLAICLVAAAPAPPAGDLARPVDVYAALDGTWTGTFVGFDASGQELYRIKVEQRYETINDTTQRVTITDTMSDGTVIRGEGENIARRRPDGTLELKCIVRKSNGERVEHDGRLVKGPDGDEQLVWYSKAPDRVETFRETVRGDVYEINGMGRYGTSMMLMHGRYTRKSKVSSN